LIGLINILKKTKTFNPQKNLKKDRYPSVTEKKKALRKQNKENKLQRQEWDKKLFIGAENRRLKKN